MNKLYRSIYDKKVSGLCGGIAQYMNIDSTFIRLALIIVTVCTGGTALFVYIIASLVVPKEPMDPLNPYHQGPRYGSGTNYGQGPTYGSGPSYTSGGYADMNKYGAPKTNTTSSTTSSSFDSMMEDIEKKAMQKELEQLRAKVAQFEKGDK